MRLLYAAVAPFLIGRLVLGCNTVSPDVGLQSMLGTMQRR